MAKISKIYETTKKDVYGFTNQIQIDVDYDPEENAYSVEQVYSWNQRKSVITDITEIFMEVPEFSKILDEIDWREIYCMEMAEKEATQEIECEND
jgi:hypothetical protein